jgi:putative glutamine amidotransferase
MEITWKVGFKMSRAEHMLRDKTYSTESYIAGLGYPRWEEIDLERLPMDKVWYVPGGYDIHPHLYGQQLHMSQLNPDQPLATLVEAKLVNYLIERGHPLIGICRGHQLIHAATGGKLVQDLSLIYPEAAWDHYSLSSLDLEDGVLRGLVQSEKGPDCGHVALNHTHHQAVVKVGSGFKPVAVDHERGIVEAAEHEDLPIITQQFHPEYDEHPWSEWYIPAVLNYLKNFLPKEVG